MLGSYYSKAPLWRRCSAERAQRVRARESKREGEVVGVEALREEGRMPYTMDTMDRQTDEKSNSFTN